MLRALGLGAGLLLGCAQTALAADLTVWWVKGYYPEEDEGIRRVVADFQKDTGTSVELTFYTTADMPVKLQAALEAGQPPDVFPNLGFAGVEHQGRWAYDGRFLDVGDVVEPLAAHIVDPAALDAVRLLNGQTGKRAYYSVPVWTTTIHIHVWRSLLEQAGLGLDKIPHEWTAFWDFLCDTAQRAVREATGKREIFGVGLPSSTVGTDTTQSFEEFLLARDAWFVDAQGKLLFDQPGMRQRIIDTLADFTRFAKKRCNPPGAVSWDDPDNNANFLNQTILMTPNGTLSIPASQRTSNPEIYSKNIATIPWPNAVDGKPLPVLVWFWGVGAYAGSHNTDGAKAFLRYLSRPEKLGLLMEAAQGRYFPVLRELAEAPFWTSTSDPHLAELRQQMSTTPKRQNFYTVSLPLEQVYAEKVWPKAIDRIIVEGWTAERAADEAIARTKQIVGG